MALPARFSLYLFSLLFLISCVHQAPLPLEESQETSTLIHSEKIEDIPESSDPRELFLQYIDKPERLSDARNLWEREGPFFTDDPYRQNILLQKLYVKTLPAPQDLLNVSLLEIDQDDLWVGTWSGGIFRYSLVLQEWEEIKEPVASLSVNSSHGVIFSEKWIGLLGYNWLSRYWKNSSRVESWQRSHPPGKLQDIIFYEGNLYLATAGNGIYRFNNEENSWEKDRLFQAAGPSINALIPSEKGFWVCTTDRGLYFWNGNTLSSEITGFPGLNVTTLIENPSALWVGTYGRGLLKINGDKRTFYSQRLNQFPDDWIISSLDTGKYHIWGTLGGGIYLQDSNGKSTLLTLQDGLGSMDIAALAWYNDSLYVGNLGGGITVIHENIIQFRLQNAEPVSR